ncbi:MAG: hypothetical protein H6887_11815 [Hoeflea sp.]|nr:hypothetical protein [Hoeflea sp.]
MSNFKIAMAGGFGGIAPSLIDKAHGLQSGAIEVWLADGNDILIPVLCSIGAMALFFVIGAVVSVIYKETVLSKAMILGIGAPALIMAAAAAGGGGTKPAHVETSANHGWVTHAFAQDAKAVTKAFDLTVKSTPDNGDCPTCTVQVMGGDNKLLSVQALDGASGETVVTIPEGASSIVFSGNNTNAVSLDVQQIVGQSTDDSKTAVIDIERDRNYWNDVQRSLGVRSIEPYDFNVKVQR